MRSALLAAPALAVLGLSACGGVTVRRTGVAAPPKAVSCDLEVLQKAPDRPYEALADLETHVTRVPPEGALSVVKPMACRLGADAIIVVRDMVLNEQGHTLVAVTAIKYRPPTLAPDEAPEPAADEAAR